MLYRVPSSRRLNVIQLSIKLAQNSAIDSRGSVSATKVHDCFFKLLSVCAASCLVVHIFSGHCCMQVQKCVCNPWDKFVFHSTNSRYRYELCVFYCMLQAGGSEQEGHSCRSRQGNLMQTFCLQQACNMEQEFVIGKKLQILNWTLHLWQALDTEGDRNLHHLQQFKYQVGLCDFVNWKCSVSGGESGQHRNFGWQELKGWVQPYTVLCWSFCSCKCFDRHAYCNRLDAGHWCQQFTMD